MMQSVVSASIKTDKEKRSWRKNKLLRYKPDLREVVRKAVSDIDYLRYKETMHSLLAKDIDTVLSLIREFDH